MVQSPLVQIYADKNPKNEVLETFQDLSRHALTDLSVNETTTVPHVTRKANLETPVEQVVPQSKNTQIEDDDLFIYETCSYQDFGRFPEKGFENVVNFLNKYLNDRAVTPDPDFGDEFQGYANLPDFQEQDIGEDVYVLQEIDVGEVTVPEIDLIT